MATVAELTLDELLDALSIDTLRRVSTGPSPDVFVTTVVIGEVRALDRLPRGALVLLPGVASGDPEMAAILEGVTRAGAAAVVIRDESGPGESFAAPPPVVLGASHDLEWGDLYEMLTRILSTRTSMVARGPTPKMMLPLFAFADAAALALNGAVSLEDSRGHVLAYSSIEGQTIDRAREEVILARHVPLTQGNRAEYVALSQSLEPVSFAVRGELPRLAIAVRAGGEVLGFLWVIVGESPPPAELGERLADAGRMAGLALLRAREVDDVRRHSRDESLRRLLNGPAEPGLLAQLGFARDAGAGVLAVRPVGGAMQGRAAATWLSDFVELAVRVRFENVRCAESDGVVYAVICAPPNRLRELGDLAKAIVERVVERQVVHVGVDAVDDIADISCARRTADRVLVALASLGAEPASATYADVRSLAVLTELAEIAMERPTLLLDGEIAEILRPGAETPIWASATLRAYLDASRNINASATRLGVHPNTVRYRLSRLRERFNLDFDNPDDRLVASLQLRLAELAESVPWGTAHR